MVSESEKIISQVQKMELGNVFTIDDLIFNCSKSNVYKILKTLRNKNIIKIAYKGIYYKIQYSTVLIGRLLPPNLYDVILILAKKNNEILQLNGGHTANLFHISKHVPMIEAFYTNGRTRELVLAGSRVKFTHVSNKKIFQYSLQPIGDALSCMYFLEERLVDHSVVQKIRKCIGEKNFSILKKLDLDPWMNAVLNDN